MSNLITVSPLALVLVNIRSKDLALVVSRTEIAEHWMVQIIRWCDNIHETSIEQDLGSFALNIDRNWQLASYPND